ncbi:MAG: hypothetical protein QM764_16170 [Chitinophagaceae bacterium]
MASTVYHWNFGDGKHWTVSTQTYTYQWSTYTIQLIATNPVSQLAIHCQRQLPFGNFNDYFLTFLID